MDVKRILVIGDSLSRGVVFDELKNRYCLAKEGFVAALQKLLGAQVCNEAKFGATIAYGKNLLAPKMAELDPQIVLIEFGGNDCDFDWNAIAENPKADHQPKTDCGVFEAGLQEMVEQIQANGRAPVLMNLPPLDAPAYFGWFTGGDRQKGREILKWLEDVSKIYWWHERYSSAIDRVARRTGAHMVDIRGEFLAREDFRSLICRDGIHPNREGHRLIFDTFRKYIEEKYRMLLSEGAVCPAH